MTPAPFEFKTAPVGGFVRCRVSAAGAEVVKAKNGHAVSACNFAEVKGGRFTEIGLMYMYARTDLVSRQLLLFGPHKTFVLRQNGGTTRARKLNVTPYYQALVATLKGLAAIRPDVRIDIGMRPMTRWILFSAGLLPLALGAVLLLGVAMGVSNKDELIDMGGLGLLFSTYGGGVVLASNPWRKRQQLSVGELARSLEARLAETAS